MKKAIAFIMALTFVFSCGFTAFASDGEEEKGTLFDYRFRFFSREEVLATAEEIASATAYETSWLEDGTESVIISIDLRAHPELGNISVFIESVRAMVDRSAEYVSDTAENVELMNYTQAAGELALHVALLMLLDRLADTGLIENIEELYIKTEIADLNIDETRVSPQFINIVGTLIMNVLNIVF